MFRIKALNDSSEDNSEDDLEQVTKEAEETIITSEYARALKLKVDGKNDEALALFSELLEAELVDQVATRDEETHALFSVKYNCLRNIGFLYAEREEQQQALQYLLKAVELDDTDIYTLTCVGKLALSVKHNFLARRIFERCQELNPNHWPSMNGLLDSLVASKSIGAAFGWALHCYNKNPKHQKARQVLQEVVTDYPEMLGMLEKVYRKGNWSSTDSFVCESTEKLFNSNCEAVNLEEVDMVCDDNKPNVEDLKITELNWMSLGKLICQLYKRSDISATATFRLEDFLQTNFTPPQPPAASSPPMPEESTLDVARAKSEEKPTVEVEFDNLGKPLGECEELDIDDNKMTAINKNGPSEIESLFGFITPDESQTNDQPDEQEDTTNKMECEPIDLVDQNTTEPTEGTSETNTDNECSRRDGGGVLLHPSISDLKDSAKRRRKGSELADLQQWGWHKNRRSKRKKIEVEEEPMDTSVNGFIRRILPKYFMENFDSETTLGHQQVCSASCTLTTEPASLNDFCAATVEEFVTFISQLSNRCFDLILLTCEYLKYLAVMWNRPMPSELHDLFVQIFEIYSTFIDFDCLNLTVVEDGSKQSLIEHIRIILFYVELCEDKLEVVPDNFCKLCIILQFYIGWLLSEPEYVELSTRHLWLLSTINYNKNLLEEALDYLHGVIYVMETYRSDLSITMPNLKKRNHFTAELVHRSIGQFKRLINLRQTRKLYAEEKYTDLIDVLQESLLGIEDVESDQHGLNRHGQIQLILESLWCEERYDHCLQWMERCLAYSVENYLITPNHSPSIKKKWAETTNFILIYFEHLLQQEGVEFLFTLDRYFARLIQTLTKLVTNQVDTEPNKTTSSLHHINVRIPWVILYYIVQREDDLNAAAIKDVDDSFRVVLMPNAIQLFFTVHEYLGRKCWCTVDDSKFLLMIIDTVTPRLRTPELEHVRNNLMEMMEQVTYCLYSYPPKKMRSKHIEEHNAKSIELTWERAVQLFDLYKPDELPEFDSFKLLSISSDMEALLQRILRVMPRCLDIRQFTSLIEDFIDNKSSKLPNDMNIMPARIQPIYYLIADFHFKNHDFSKAISYYIQDLVLVPRRFDSWVGLSLSKNKKLVEQLNSCDDVEPKVFLAEAAKCIRCYQQGLKLNDKHRCLWIEYGQLLYHLHSFCARSLKLKSDSLSMDDFHFIEEQKDEYIKTASNAFNNLTKLAEQAAQNEQDAEASDEDANEGQDEKWLYYYMLGKISEKKHEEPKRYLDYYLMSAKCLYEKGATYPLKINHMNPSNLAIEALELYYRTTAAIIKYLEQHYTTLSRPNAKLFTRVLRDLANSPFAINRAKIKGAAALKRKLTSEAGVKSDEPAPKIMLNGGDHGEAVTITTNISSTNSNNVNNNEAVNNEAVMAVTTVPENSQKPLNGKPPIVNGSVEVGNMRRSSHESGGVTSTTSTNDSSSSSSSSSSGTDSSSDSESDSSDEDQIVKASEIDALFKSCIRNLEECVTRFPEHYKSTYRLVHHYLNAKGSTKSIDNCRMLLLSTYRTTLGSNITGLFTDRKTNNLFNGVWRIPSDEIDRPGNFSAHLSKCVVMLIDILKKEEDYGVLFEVALLLHKNPESDKKYLIESERKELYQQAMLYSSLALKTKFKQLKEQNDDPALLKFLIEIYKIHRKTQKFIQPKENPFNSVMVDVYKAYVADKAVIPETANIVDLSIKLCVYEMNVQKQREKDRLNLSKEEGAKSTTIEEPTTPYIPGLSKKKIDKLKRVSFSTFQSTPEPFRNSTTTTTTTLITAPVITINSNSPISSTTTIVPSSSSPTSSTQPIVPPLYSNLLPKPLASPLPLSSPTAAAAAAFINEYAAKNNNNPISAAAPFDQGALLAELYKTPNLLSAIPGMNLSAMLSLLQQQNQLYSRLSTMTSAAAANTNYSNFALKYIESMASNLMTSISNSALPTTSPEFAAAAAAIASTSVASTSSLPPAKNSTKPPKSTKQKSSSSSAAANGNQKVKKATPSTSTSNAPALAPAKKQGNNTNKHSSISKLPHHLTLPVDLPASLSITPAVSMTPKSNAKPKQPTQKQQHNRTEQRPLTVQSSSPLTISPVLSAVKPSKVSQAQAQKPVTNKTSSSKVVKSLSVPPGALETLSKLGSSISLITEKESASASKETSRSNNNTQQQQYNQHSPYFLEFARQVSLSKQNTIDLTGSSPSKNQQQRSGNPSKNAGNDTPKSSSNVGTIRVKKDSKLLQKTVSGIQIPNSISVSPVTAAARFSPSPSISPSLAAHQSSTKSYRPINASSPSSLQYTSSPRNLAASISPLPSSTLDISPTKTLQQKLAEKQKENQTRISMNSNHGVKHHNAASTSTGAIPKKFNMSLTASASSSPFMREFEKMATKKIIQPGNSSGTTSRPAPSSQPQKKPSEDVIIVLDD